MSVGADVPGLIASSGVAEAELLTLRTMHSAANICDARSLHGSTPRSRKHILFRQKYLFQAEVSKRKRTGT